MVVVEKKNKNLLKRIEVRPSLQWRVWKLGKKETRKAFQDRLRKLSSAEAEILLVHSGIRFWRLVKNFVDGEGKGGSKGGHE